MKKYIVTLFLLPLIACAKNKNQLENPKTVQQITTNIDIPATNHARWNSLLQKYVSKNGKVNYAGFQKDSKELKLYLNELATNAPTNSWSKNATLAFWINAYNAYTVQLIVTNYPTKSIKDISNPWGAKFILIGGKKYSLEEIENEILRKMNEPRIHFAINCASLSCPDLLNEAYTASKLEQQLKMVTTDFINDPTKNTISTSRVEVSKIFDWFAADFKQKGTVIDFINQYSRSKINGSAKTSYKYYNWNLNN